MDLKEIRKALGWPQGVMAEALGLTRTNYNKIENGVRSTIDISRKQMKELSALVAYCSNNKSQSSFFVLENWKQQLLVQRLKSLNDELVPLKLELEKMNRELAVQGTENDKLQLQMAWLKDSGSRKLNNAFIIYRNTIENKVLRKDAVYRVVKLTSSIVAIEAEIKYLTDVLENQQTSGIK